MVSFPVAACPQCSASCAAVRAVVQVQLNLQYEVPVEMWRYECRCGRVWANEEQRTVNYQSYKRARRSA